MDDGQDLPLLVTVHISYQPGEAAAIAGTLEAAGIFCHVATRHTAQILWYDLVAFGGMEL